MSSAAFTLWAVLSGPAGPWVYLGSVVVFAVSVFAIAVAKTSKFRDVLISLKDKRIQQHVKLKDFQIDPLPNAALSAAAGVMGRATSPKKAAAVRRNGKLGGAPPKYQPGQSVTVRAGAPVALVGLSGIVSAYVARSVYLVRINSQDHKVRSWWLANDNLRT